MRELKSAFKAAKTNIQEFLRLLKAAGAGDKTRHHKKPSSELFQESSVQWTYSYWVHPVEKKSYEHAIYWVL